MTAKQQLRIIRNVIPNAHLVVVVVNLDVKDALSINELRAEIQLPESVPMLPCGLHDKESVKSVLKAVIAKAGLGKKGQQLIEAVNRV